MYFSLLYSTCIYTYFLINLNRSPGVILFLFYKILKKKYVIINSPQSRLLCPNEFAFKKDPMDTHFCSLFFERIWGSKIALMGTLIQSWIHLSIFIDNFECIFRLTNYIAPNLHWILFFISNVDLLGHIDIID